MHRTYQLGGPAVVQVRRRGDGPRNVEFVEQRGHVLVDILPARGWGLSRIIMATPPLDILWASRLNLYMQLCIRTILHRPDPVLQAFRPQT